jgi:uncharacterized protein (DUF1778 family)
MPKTIAVRSERIDLRTNSEVKALIERAAQLRNTTLSSYLLDSALQKAKEDLQETETILLREADRDLFFLALMSPPSPNAALRGLFTKKQARKA